MANEISQNSRKDRALADAPLSTKASSIVQLSTFESQDNISMLDELQSRLAAKDRRIYQLQGERIQLTRLLNESLETIQSLNRRIGRLEAQSMSHRFALVRSRLVAGCRRLAERISIFQRFINPPPPRIDSAKPIIARPVSKSAKAKFPPLMPHEKTSSPKPILAVVVLEMSGAEIEAAMPMINKTCETRKLSPLLLVDSDDFGKLRKSNFIFEYLPPKEDRERFGPDLNWDLYFQRRLADIRRKWNPVKVISFGRAGSDLVELWDKSVFEPTPISTMT